MEVRYGNQGCETCGKPIFFEYVTAPEGQPDFILGTEDAWCGWAWATPDHEKSKLELLCLCSRACLEQWLDDARETGV